MCEKRGGRVAAGEEVFLSGIAAAIGEPARTRMLLSLMDGHARTSTELSAVAEVTPSTASAHLSCLTERNLVRVSIQGRHRYYSLRGAEVAAVLEGLGVVAGTNIREFVPSTPERLRRARSCYDHIAGRLAVRLHDYFLDVGWIRRDPDGKQGAYGISEAGQREFEQLGIDMEEVLSLRRRLAYACMDWSERRPHLAGSLGAALLKATLARKWIVRESDGRALTLSRMGEREIWKRFGIAL